MGKLAKLGKKRDDQEILGPLLSVLRQVLAFCILIRNLKKLLQRIPPSQAEYQQGRSTTELVFSFKTLAEKAITSTRELPQ